MLNLPVFKSLIKSNVKIVLYFHENQITYPWSDNDPDIKLKRDQHYGFINYTSALIADEIIFMDEGLIVERAPTKEFFANPKNDRTKLFLSQIL